MSGAFALLAIGLVFGGPARAGAAAGTVCLVATAAADGLEPGAVRAALLLEARKAGRAVRFVRAPADAGCRAESEPLVRVTLRPGARARIDGGRAAAREIDLSDTLAIDRAGAVARAALAALPEGVTAGPPEVLVDVSTPVVPPPPPSPVPVAPALVLTAGGGYVRWLGTGTDAGAIDGEVALSLFDGRLSLGAAGAWSPAAQVRGGDPAATLLAGELLGVARGGLPLGPVALRLGVGGGYQWRRLEVRSAFRLDEDRATSGVAVLAVEPELVWRFAARFSAHLVLPGRVYLGGTRHHWKGLSLRDDPRGAVGVGLRLGVRL